MKNHAALGAICMVLFLFLSSYAVAQTPGLIVRPAGGPYSTVLDPDQNGFTSPTTTGFITTDVGVGNSEIPYKVIPPFKLEPTSDLMRGPNELFSDLVRLNADESGFYVFSTGGANPNLLFRMRLGSIVSGSKGYSVLIDADQKFGATGPYADPNYQAATTGSNGNPGFEYEVVLETNFRVAVYNVDGGSTPTLINSYSTASNSQISIAISTVSGTPDYFYDFYVPLSALTGVTATTPLRMSATTVMAPQAAIGGPKSDIFGYDGTDYMKAWEALITNQPAFTANDVTTNGMGIKTTCTAAPTLNSPVIAGTVTISGKWTQADASKPATTATITVFKNGVALPTTTTVSTGGTWSIPNITAAAGDMFYAKAQSSGETSCLQSNSVLVPSCASRTSNTGFAITCATIRGISGTRPSGAVVKIYTVAAAGYTVYATDNSGVERITYPTATTWEYQGANKQNSDPCGGGQSDVDAGSYAFTVQSGTSCESDYIYSCIGGTQTAIPTITQAQLFSGSTIVSGTAAAGATVRLFKDGSLRATTTATTAGAYSFTGLSLNLGEVIDIYAQASGSCVSAKVTRTVTCFTSAPIIITGNQGNLAVGATSIKGTSSEPVGTTIRVYDNSGVVIGTTTVQSGGTWSVAVTVVSGKSYYAKAQNGTCGESAASATASALAATTVCPIITVPAGGYLENSTVVTGTIPTFTGDIRLYQDGTQIALVTISNTTTWSIPVNQNTTTYADRLYAGGVLTVSAQATSSTENSSCTSTTTVMCTPPSSTFTVSPVSTATVPFIVTSITQNIILSGSESGILYTLEDNSGVDKAISKFGNGSAITFTVVTMPTIPGTYNWRIKATKITGTCSDIFKQVYFVVTDNDNDNIANFVDIDDDNDGILDANETATYDATGDADGDGIPNYKDTTPGTGLPTTDSNGDGIIDYYDTDRDGIINQFDVDADNDGIPDIIENGGTDSDNDGKVDGTTDADGDGLRDSVDANTSGTAGSNGLAITDFDGDGVPNFKDLDADGDGVLDSRESGLTFDTNNNGLLSDDAGYADVNKDGWSDGVDALSGPLLLRNTDGRSKPDYLDIDNDDDGIVDNIEARATVSTLVPSGTDSDGDGIDNAYDNVSTAGTFGGNTNNGITPVNSDTDNMPDYRDLDSDNDGFPDAFEGHDTNGDNLPNANAATKNGVGGTVDADGDGLLDGYDNNTTAVNPTNSTSGSSYPNIDKPGTPERDWREAIDSDGDGIADFTDTDDDNDGIPDLLESGGIDPLGDADGDGILNYLDTTPGSGLPPFTDTNKDGINDAYDADGDGIINSVDLDSDNDGVPDIVEAFGVDTNGDGRVDGTVADADGDGLADKYDATTGGVSIPNVDTDGDGIKNFLDLDSDNDGIPDVVESGGVDADGDGRIDTYRDADGDGLDSRIDGDADNNGTVENTTGALIITGTDNNNDGRPDMYPRSMANADGRGLPNAYDLDSDDDGITDLVEEGGTDADNNGKVDVFVDVDKDGFADAYDGDAGNDGVSENTNNALVLTRADANNDGRPEGFAKGDFDNDGFLNPFDIDSDNDGITDNVEGQSTATYTAPKSTDADGDGIDDNFDMVNGFGGAGVKPVDSDGDGAPDYLDKDSDNDTQLDVVEGNDFNGNGKEDDIVTPLGIDTDGDGLDDRFETNINNGPVVTIIGFSGAGAGSLSTAQRTPNLATDRDWRNSGFKLAPHTVLPVKFIAVAAIAERAAGIAVTWRVTSEQDVKMYEVERSADGNHFTKIGEVPFREAAGSENSYRFFDKEPTGAKLYYRIRQVDIDGRFMYSTIVSVGSEVKTAGIAIYPNPVSTQTVVELQARISQRTTITIADLQGRVVTQQSVQLQKGINRLQMYALPKLSKGAYCLWAEVDGVLQQIQFVR